jgi:transposase-like protein
MKILAKCPRCGHVLRCEKNQADKRKLCPSCRRTFKVPAINHLGKPMEIIESAENTLYVDESGKLYG